MQKNAAQISTKELSRHWLVRRQKMPPWRAAKGDPRLILRSLPQLLVLGSELAGEMAECNSLEEVRANVNMRKACLLE
jgi:hypothetical protein